MHQKTFSSDQKQNCEINIEILRIYRMNLQKNDIKILIPEGAKKILDTLHNAGFEAYVVGGCVRDSILSRKPMDFDITTSALPMEVKSLFKRTIDTGIKHGTVTVMINKEGYEVTTYRVDGAYEDHRHPKDVTFTSNLLEDLKRRDFTINAMAYNDKDGLVDAFGGIEDLEKGIIRCVGDPMKRFEEDALRILRALRFSAQLSKDGKPYDIDEKTASAMSQLSQTLKNVSAERIQTELIKLMTSDHPERLRLGYELGITKVFFPEFNECIECSQNNSHHVYNVGDHILRSCMEVPNDKILRLTMLFHDIGKPRTKTVDEYGVDHFFNHPAVSAEMARSIMHRLKFDNATLKLVCKLVENHDLLLTDKITEVRVRKAMFKIGPDYFDYFLMIKKADMLAQNHIYLEEKTNRLKEIKKCADIIRERNDCLSLKQLAVKGKDLMDAGVCQGRLIGSVLEAMLNDVIKNPTHNDKDYLLKHLKNYEVNTDIDS